MDIVYRDNAAINLADLLALYEDAGWTFYTHCPQLLQQALQGSLYQCSAWHGAELAGLIRVVGDGTTIIYVQDILVKEAYQRQGIGSRLLQTVMQKFNHVRQIVLLTDDQPATRAFYLKNGFQESGQAGCASFVRFNQTG